MKDQREYLVTSEEMMTYDRNTIEVLGIPGMVLMERAALSAYEALKPWLKESMQPTILILAGVGNNGGDGLALARLLAEAGYTAEVWCVGDQERASEQWKQQKQILSFYPVRTGSKPEREEYTIWIDALFGVGLSREITGEYAQAVAFFNNGAGRKLALDIPSGIHADSGQILGCAVRAEQTITFGFCKRGLKLYPGCEYAGRVKAADIGIGEKSFCGREPELFCYRGEAAGLLKRRDPSGNKGTFGKVLLIAGDVNMAGAAVLAARAACRTGAGMVRVLSHPQNRLILQQAVPEALFGVWTELPQFLEWADVIAIGPGLGRSGVAQECLRTVLCGSRLPVLADADALNLIAEECLDLIPHLIRQGREGRSIVLTPHVGELSRLTGKEAAQLKKQLLMEAGALAGRLGAVIVAKDARTFVCGPEPPVFMNTAGNSGMATAGSGDVLAGIISGLMAQGMEAWEAACAGVYWHACAGDAAAADKGEYALTAGDLVEQLGRVSLEAH